MTAEYKSKINDCSLHFFTFYFSGHYKNINQELGKSKPVERILSLSGTAPAQPFIAIKKTTVVIFKTKINSGVFMISYHAPNPYPTSQNRISLFFSRLFSSVSSSASIGKLILPAQWRAPANISQRGIENLQNNYHVTIDSGYIRTHDNALLDTIEIKPLNPSDIYIIKFNGNGGQYTDLLKEYAHDAQKLNATVIGFNYRGVGYSSPHPDNYQDLITDGIAQVQRLLDSGVASNHILLDGHSLGGSIATMVAKHFHDKNLPVYLWNDRSFSTLSRAAAGIVTPSSIQFSEDVVASSSYVGLSSTGWSVDAGSAYRQLSPQYKGYMFVSKKTGDGVISHNASLHKAVKSQERNEQINTGHKMTANQGAGHNLSRHHLFSKTGKTAQAEFEEFVSSMPR